MISLRSGLVGDRVWFTREDGDKGRRGKGCVPWAMGPGKVALRFTVRLLREACVEGEAGTGGKDADWTSAEEGVAFLALDDLYNILGGGVGGIASLQVGISGTGTS